MRFADIGGAVLVASATCVTACADQARTTATTPTPAVPAPAVVSLSALPIQLLVIDSVVQLRPVMTDAAGHVVTNRQPFWSSSSPGTATVDSNGVVRARALGVATIFAAIDGVHSEVTVQVGVAAASFALSPNKVWLGDTTLVRGVPRDASGNELLVLTGFVIQDTTIAAVLGRQTSVCPGPDSPLGTMAPCRIRAKKAGATAVTGFVNGRQFTTTLQVVAPPG